jgi:hypothetical protein
MPSFSVSSFAINCQAMAAWIIVARNVFGDCPLDQDVPFIKALADPSDLVSALSSVTTKSNAAKFLYSGSSGKKKTHDAVSAGDGRRLFAPKYAVVTKGRASLISHRDSRPLFQFHPTLEGSILSWVEWIDQNTAFQRGFQKGDYLLAHAPAQIQIRSTSSSVTSSARRS